MISIFDVGPSGLKIKANIIWPSLNVLHPKNTYVERLCAYFFKISYFAHVPKHYNNSPKDRGPSWLTFIGHMKDSLWSVDFFRCESISLKTHWVMVVMDPFNQKCWYCLCFYLRDTYRHIDVVNDNIILSEQ